MIKIFLLISLYSTILSTNLSAKSNSFGVEINPLKTLIFLETFSIGMNYFDYKNNAEIAIPINIKGYSKHNELYREMSATVDFRYRKYLKSLQDGSYLGILGRYTYLQGKANRSNKLAKVHKVGLGFELGYRYIGIFSEKDLYWGASFALGRYFSSDNDSFNSYSFDVWVEDRDLFFDIELFKIGYIF